MSIGTDVRRTLLMLLTGIGAMLLAWAATYGLMRLYILVSASPEPGVWGLLYALLALICFPLMLLAGGGMMFECTAIVENNMIGKLLPALAPGGLTVWLGMTLCDDAAFVSGLPGFLMGMLEPVRSEMGTMGIYLLLFGIGWVLAGLFWPMRLSRPEALLRSLLILLLVLLCIAVADYYAMVSRAKFPVPLLGWIGVIVCGVFNVLNTTRVVHTLAYSTIGKMKGLFWILYLIGGFIALLGLWQVIDLLFVNTYLVKNLLSGLIPIPDYRYRWLVYGASGLLFAIGMTVSGVCFLLSTIFAHLEKCPCCGGYACQRMTEKAGTVKKLISGMYDHITTTAHTTVMPRARMAWTDYERETEHYQEVTRSGIMDIHCRYCRGHLGQTSFSHTDTEKIGSDHESWSEIHHY